MRPTFRAHAHLALAATAAFGTYFCMYAFRKPFTAATFEGEEHEIFGLGLKTVLILAQIAGYMLSKFIGIKVISEMTSRYRAPAIIGLIVAAELALVGFAVVPVPWKVVMLFLNGLPLGMVFGLVLGYLEGRRQTEALAAVLCASFIVSSGVVKSVGTWLLQAGFDAYQMPMVAGAIFFVPLVICVGLLSTTPPPNEADRHERTERTAMDRTTRRQFVQAYGVGLTLMVLIYVVLTIVRTIRDDFGVEIWRDLGVTEQPEVFSQSETAVAIGVTALNGLAIWIRHNLTALRLTMGLMAVAFVLVGGSALLQQGGLVTPMAFMILCGVGLYVPYVAFHTTAFERLIAASKRPCNLGFLMYLADAIGYLGYAGLMVVKASSTDVPMLPLFLWALLVGSVVSIGAVVAAIAYFERALATDRVMTHEVVPDPLTDATPVERLADEPFPTEESVAAEAELLSGQP